MSAALLDLERKWHAANNAWNAAVGDEEWKHRAHEVKTLEKRFLSYPANDLEDVWTKYRFLRFWMRCDEDVDSVCQQTKDALAALEAALRSVFGDGNGEPLPDGGCARVIRSELEKSLEVVRRRAEALEP